MGYQQNLLAEVLKALLPLKPDPNAALCQAMRSPTRAAITTGLAALDRSIGPAKFAEKTWPEDSDVASVLRASSGLLTRDDAPALSAISTAFLSALKRGLRQGGGGDSRGAGR
jgi:hypothetical protein